MGSSENHEIMETNLYFYEGELPTERNFLNLFSTFGSRFFSLIF